MNSGGFMMIEDLFRERIVSLAKLPQDNTLDIDHLGNLKLLLIPIDHDYAGGSAAMHNALFRKYNLHYRTAFVVANPEDIRVIMDTFRDDPRYVGGGMGSGFKEKAIRCVDELDDSARFLGSINVVEKRNGKLVGYNTDGIGFVQGFLSEYPHGIENKKIVILGAGGTTLPVAYELARNGPRDIVILNRTVNKAEAVAEKISAYVYARSGGQERIGEELKNADIVINTSNKGAHPEEGYTAFGPMTEPYKENYLHDMKIAFDNLAQLPKAAIVADILLEHEPMTLRVAHFAGYRTHHGRSMNLYQAIPAIKIMTGIRTIADVDLEKVMRGAIGL